MTLEAQPAPKGSLARGWRAAKRLLIGAPIATAEQAHERLTKLKALAVFSSDALSSVACATEAILIGLVVGGAQAIGYVVPIGIAITILLAIVAISYRQTIYAYPNGGDSYIVSKDNLGTLPGLVGGASLLIDYVLTVAVSVSAGVEAISNGVPAFKPPESRNAAITLQWMAILLGIMVVGTAVLASALNIIPHEGETALSIMGAAIFGRGVFYQFLQWTTFLILVLAANTAFGDFPRLSSIMAKDKFLPGQFSFQGDRLAFTNGIIVLGVVSAGWCGSMERTSRRLSRCMRWACSFPSPFPRRAW